jgi:hypothetical protein
MACSALQLHGGRMIRLPSLALLMVLALTAPALAQGRLRDCLNTPETAEMITREQLSSPALALRTASAHQRAEPLRLVLCRLDGDFVYQITLLRRDGKVLRSRVRARDGVLLNAE